MATSRGRLRSDGGTLTVSSSSLRQNMVFAKPFKTYSLRLGSENLFLNPNFNLAADESQNEEDDDHVLV